MKYSIFSLFLFILFHSYAVTFDVDERLIGQLWERRAIEWDLYIAERKQRDFNRYYQSDPVVLGLLQNIERRTVLDVGCGNGYFSEILALRGAHVVGIDISNNMIEIARQHALVKGLDISYQVDNAMILQSITDESTDVLLANYVLMDLPDPLSAIYQFHRVLKQKGIAIIVCSHPCFPRSYSSTSSNSITCIEWKEPYFQEHLIRSQPCPGFSEEFIAFHHPLSTYWKMFKKAGFEITDFLEPFIQDIEIESENLEIKSILASRPRSIVFVLHKTSMYTRGDSELGF